MAGDKRVGGKRGDGKPAETIRFIPEDAESLDRMGRRWGSLLVVQGAELDLGKLVVCDRPVAIGRDDEVELPLRDGSISRRHCRVERDDATGRYVLVDLGSTNGTRVNGSRVTGSVPLAEGDKIFLGASVLKFSWADDYDVAFQERLESIVKTDALTGLMAKRAFDAEFAKDVQQALETGSALSVLVMDMDGLKQINDTHGHEMGGFAITEAAQIIRDRVAARGETTRFGGDEFMSILPGTDKTTARQIAEQIRDGVAQHVFEKNGVRVAPTISIGVSTLPEDGDSTELLFRSADRALYRAKAAGKNQVGI
jgi:two-component system, cell cycle response regulator